MGKVLFFVLIGVIVWLLFFARRGIGKIDEGKGKSEGKSAPWSNAPEQMRQCARCGVHIPVSEACELAAQRGKYSCVDPDICANRRG
jgi:hypothetical protein